jgi:hypothetical protein
MHDWPSLPWFAFDGVSMMFLRLLLVVGRTVLLQQYYDFNVRRLDR